MFDSVLNMVLIFQSFWTKINNQSFPVGLSLIAVSTRHRIIYRNTAELHHNFPTFLEKLSFRIPMDNSFWSAFGTPLFSQ